MITWAHLPCGCYELSLWGRTLGIADCGTVFVAFVDGRILSRKVRGRWTKELPSLTFAKAACVVEAYLLSEKMAPIANVHREALDPVWGKN